MSEPPPTAVLITNSDGRVGCVTVAADADPATDALGDGAVAPPPHAVATSIPAPTVARRRLAVTFHMPCTSTHWYAGCRLAAHPV
jgi:hypothetical protein